MSLAQALASRRRCGFIPFITAGDPSLAATARYVRTLAEAGADIIELGVPFSDPMADGPTIQAADQRALKSKTTLLKVLALVVKLRRGGLKTPIVLFTYLNPILALGHGAFARLCAKSGVDGVLMVDLPVEEAGGLLSALKKNGVESVLLASPTSSDERLKAIGRASGSIVYYVSREGVTGARRGLSAGLAARVRLVRRLTGKPLIVGFGVSTAQQARLLSKVADGVVVGSALVAAAALSGNAGLKRLSRRLVAGLGGTC